MFEFQLSQRRLSPRLVAATLIALAVAAPVFGFGGHIPPPAPGTVVPPQGGNPQPPDTGGGPTPGTEPPPPALLQPTPDDILPPVFTDGGTPGCTSPPDQGVPSSAPEPATLLMGAMGASLAALWARRRRKSN